MREKKKLVLAQKTRNWAKEYSEFGMGKYRQDDLVEVLYRSNMKEIIPFVEYIANERNLGKRDLDKFYGIPDCITRFLWLVIGKRSVARQLRGVVIYSD